MGYIGNKFFWTRLRFQIFQNKNYSNHFSNCGKSVYSRSLRCLFIFDLLLVRNYSILSLHTFYTNERALQTHIYDSRFSPDISLHLMSVCLKRGEVVWHEIFNSQGVAASLVWVISTCVCECWSIIGIKGTQTRTSDNYKFYKLLLVT